MDISDLRKDDFYLPILRTLIALGGSAANEEMETRIIEEGGFSVADQEAVYPKSGQLMLPDKISWGRYYLKQANLISNEKRGLYVITEEGRAALDAGETAVFEAVVVAMREYNKNYQAKKALGPALANAPPDDFALEEVAQDDVSGEIWSDQLLAKLQSIDPSAFERLCQRLLRENGFIQVR